MGVAAVLPKVGTVLITAVIDSINPCAIGVLILLLSSLIVLRKSRQKVLFFGTIYISAVYVTYFSAGLGLTYFLASIPLVAAQYISLAVAAIVVLGGLIEVKNFFWYGQGISLAISPKHAAKIHKMTKKITLPALIVLGVFVAAVELPCTGGPYLAITLILAQNFDVTAVILLAIYNVIFVMPLVVILLLVYSGMKLHEVKMWKHANKHFMRLAIGFVLIALGWILLLIANGTINLG
ncbi:hypothetical protein HZA99_01540 [Candidatus Woesearchaeota archaeon]|nr:hypothetical protein [Candidatus Woesearchaeota archaeon]